MIVEKYVLGVCFVPLDVNTPKFFGFSEFLAGLALMVLAWTIADDRYRFRIRVAPLPLRGLTFGVVTAVGVLTLLTDLWRAQGWLVPKVSMLTPATWQALLAGLFFITFLAWIWFAFIRPSTFNKLNAKRFAQAVPSYILKGSPEELAVVADELIHSAKEIVRYATDWSSPTHTADSAGKPTKTEICANQLLSLIADRRLCRVIVQSSPGTALALFRAIGETKKYGLRMDIFAKNIVHEALENKDSFLYHETSGYETGLIGEQKPLSMAMFSNYEMVETIDTMLDADLSSKFKWDSDRWEVYCRIVLLTFRDYVDKGKEIHSYVLYRAFGNIKNAANDLYKLNGVASSAWDDDLHACLRVAVDFIKEAVEILDKKGVPANLQPHIKNKQRPSSENVYDYIANLIYELIFDASAVTSPRDLCWWIQHNALWGNLFNFDHLSGQAGTIVKYKVFRLLYSDIAEMKRLPNFKGARIVGYCLNVMGLRLQKEEYYKDSRALHKALLIFARKYYARIHNYNPRVAEACLVDGVTYDAENHRLVRTYPADGLNPTPLRIYFNVDTPTSDSSNTPAEDANPEQ